MDRPLDSHEPTPEFRNHLEWQIETALRRESRLAEPVSMGATSRFRIAVVAIAALLIGGLAGMVPGFAQENKERERLMESARTEESLTRLRMQLAESEYQEAKRRVDVGVSDREALLLAAAQLEAYKAALAKTLLDMEEIRATSNAPRNDLDAPLVGGRDFVRDRLMLELQTAQRALTAAESEASREKKRWEVGMATPLELQQADSDVAAALARMRLLSDTLDLRQRALKGDIKSGDLAPALRKLELAAELQQAERELHDAQSRLVEARRRASVGTASEVDLKRAELQVMEQQLALIRIQQQLQALTGVKK